MGSSPTQLDGKTVSLSDWRIGRVRQGGGELKVPGSWELVRVCDVARLESGHTPSRRKPEYWDGDVPWISLHDSKHLDCPVIAETAQTIGPLGLANSSARLLPAGTVVFSRTATVGKATIMAREMSTSQDFANYVCGKRLHNVYLMHLLRHMQPEWHRLMAGSTHNTVYMPVFKELEILLPPLPEQKKIAAILSSVDEAIEKTQAVIDQVQVVKKGLMQELLTRGLPGRHARFKKTEIGEIPEEWEVARIDAVGEVQLGKMRSHIHKDGQLYPYLRVANIMDGYVDTTDVLTMLFTEKEVEKFGLKPGDILLNEGQSVHLVGRSAMYRGDPPECAFQKTLLRFRAGPQVRPLFALRVFQWFLYSGVFADVAVQTTSMAHLTAVRFSAMAFPVPPLVEQDELTRLIDAFDARYMADQATLKSLRTVKAGLMSVLLTGEVRVRVEEGDAA